MRLTGCLHGIRHALMQLRPVSAFYKTQRSDARRKRLTRTFLVIDPVRAAVYSLHNEACWWTMGQG